MLFIIVGVIVTLLILIGGIYLLLARTALIGALSQDSYNGLNFKRPSNWEKDTSNSNTVYYHPKQAINKDSGNNPTYAVKMGIQFEGGIFGDAPDDMNASDKASLQDAIDDGIANASSSMLPSKSSVGCDEDPVFKDKPKKIDVPKTFLAMSYSFTCKVTVDKNSQTFYFDVVDLVPNDKDAEYVIQVGAASTSIYETNKAKITEIMNSFSF